jgi:uncharacterized membrane protein YfcA
MELTFGFFVIAALATVFAGISKGGFGSGAAFASATILALVIEPGKARGIMLPLLMLVDVATLKPYRGRWHWPEAKVLLLGGIPGVGLGVVFYTLADDDLLRLLIGGIALLFVIWQLSQKFGLVSAPQKRLPSWVGVIAGVVTGFTSFVSHAGGPPAAVYMLSQRLGKLEYQATSVLIFWIINIAKFVPYAFLGIFTTQTLLADLVLAPFAILGAWIGVRAHFMLSERLFFGITYVLLSVTGSKLIWDAMM